MVAVHRVTRCREREPRFRRFCICIDSACGSAHESRIRSGIIAYDALNKMRAGDKSAAVKRSFEEHKRDLGYALMLKKYHPAVVGATDAQIKQATLDTIPRVAPLFWSFRLMVAAGVLMLFIFAAAFYFCARRAAGTQRWLLRLALYSIPLPWIAAEAGWFVAEYGRQPWTIGEVLPTFLSSSNLTVGHLQFSLAGFLGFYTFLLVIELYLMFKYARLGPSSLHTGRYDLEPAGAPALAMQPQDKAR